MERDRIIDLIRGLAIILMVLGHSRFYDVGVKFIYLFHMATFFIISGYCFKPTYCNFVQDIKQYIIRKIKSIWVPYFIWNCIYTLCNNLFIKLHFYSNQNFQYLGTSVSAHEKMTVVDMGKNILKGIFMSGRTEMGGAFWFLRALFVVSIMFFFVDYLLHILVKTEKMRVVLNFSLAVFLSCFAWICQIKGIKSIGIDVYSETYIFFLLGHLLKKYKLTQLLLKGYVVLICVLVLICSTVWGTSISVGANTYVNPPYLLINAIAGFCVLFALATVLAHLDKLANVIAYIGKNTLAIVVLHFLVFKIVSFLIIWVNGSPLEYLAVFPAINQGQWWFVYCIVGIIVPLALLNIRNSILKVLKKIF